MLVFEEGFTAGAGEAIDEKMYERISPVQKIPLYKCRLGIFNRALIMIRIGKILPSRKKGHSPSSDRVHPQGV